MTPVSLVAALLLTVWGFLNPFLQPGSRAAEEGERSYDRGDWERSLERFGQARMEDADPDLDYNLGAAAYRAGRYEEAADAFTAAESSPRLAPGRPAYNLGNARYMAGDYQGAMDAFRETLRADPANEDARLNYELARRQLEAGAPPPQSQPDQGDSGDDDQKQNQDQKSQSPPDSSGQAEQKPEPGASDQQDQGEQTPPPSAGDQQDQSETGEPAEEGPTGDAQPVPDPDRLLSAEEARQLLNQITPEERELLEARLKSSRRRQVEKDW